MTEERRPMNSLSIIENTDIQAVQGTMDKISQFQKIVQSSLTQNHDFGVIPGTPKPTLLKPGAEKIAMLMGLRSEFEIVDSTRDWEKGFFQYQVKAKLLKDEVCITEGLGACNNKEKKYLKLDPFGLDNTILKMAKKRALVDAALMVGSLSNIFTQDLEDIDLSGQKASTQQQNRTYTDGDGTITKPQAKRVFALAKGNAAVVRTMLDTYGYKKSEEIKKVEYEDFCKKIEELAAKEGSEQTG